MNRTPRIKPFAEKLILAFEPEMSPDHVAMLMQRDVAHRTYEKIAADFGIQIGTVKSRINRARIRINLLRANAVHPNGNPKFADDGTMLDEQGNRSIFDDVDE